MLKKTKEVTIYPRGSWVLVSPEIKENETPSGLVVSTSEKEIEQQTGIVQEIGGGTYDRNGNDITWDIELGQRVFYKKYSANEIEVDGEKWLLIDESDIIAVLE